MNIHPSSQLLRFLKAYYKITNKTVNNIEGFEHTVWLNSISENPYVLQCNESNELLRFLHPCSPACPLPDKSLASFITSDFCDPQLSNDIILKSLNLNDCKNNTLYLEIKSKMSKYFNDRTQWLNDLVTFNKYSKLYCELKDLIFTYNNNDNLNLVLGNGLLKLNKDGVDIHFPLIHQPVSLILANDNNIVLKKISEPYLNTDILTSIPGVSALAIENCIDSFSKNKLDLPGGTKLNSILTEIFKNITTGNRNLISLNYSPVLFLLPIKKPFSDIINNLLIFQKNRNKASALDYFLNCSLPKLSNTNALDNLGNFNLLNLDLTSIDILTTLEQDNICLVNSRASTDYISIITNAISHYLSKEKNILIIEPTQKYVNNLTKNLPSIIFNKNVANSKSFDNNLFKEYKESYNNLACALDNIKECNIKKGIYSNDLSKNNNQLYWNDDAVYQKGLLIGVLKDTNNIIYDIFEKYPYTKIIANQNKIKSLKEDWLKLIKLIDDFTVFYKSSKKTLNGVNIELNKLLKLDFILKTVNEIIDYLKRKHKLRRLDYTYSRPWKNVINSCLVNNHKPKILNDFLLIKMHIERQILKNKLIQMWSKMMVTIGEGELSKKDNNLIKCLSKYYNNIVKSSNWYENTWRIYINKLLECGFKWKEFFNQYAQQYIEYDLIDTLSKFALTDLTKLLTDRIKYTKEDLLYDSNKNVTDLINTESCVIDLTASLKPINAIKNEINLGYEQNFNSMYKNSFNIMTYQQFIDETIKNNNSFYDLIIINNSEKIDIYGVLALCVTEKCLVIGDKNQYYKECVLNDYETISELSESLLANVKNKSNIINSNNLFDLIEGNCVTLYSLNNNTINPLSVVNCLNKLCYNNNLRYLGNKFNNSIFAIDMTSIIKNENKFYDYILKMITDLNKKTNSSKKIILVDLSNNLYLMLNKLINENNLSNVLVSNINGLSNDYYDIVLALDFHNDYSKVLKYDNNIRAELCTILARTQEFFCYMYNTSHTNDLLPIQNELVDFIEFNSIHNSITYSNTAVKNLANSLAEHGIRSQQNILLNNLEIDLAIIIKTPILIIDKRKVTSLNESLIKRLLQLSKSDLQVILVDLEQDVDSLYTCLKNTINIDFITKLATDDFNYTEFFNKYLTNFQAKTNECIKKELNIPFKEVAVSDNLVADNEGFNEINKSLKNQINSLKDVLTKNKRNTKYGFTDLDINNKAALFNFSDEDIGYDETFSFEPFTNEQHSLTKNANTTPSVNNSNITYEKNATAFNPDSDTYANLYLQQEDIKEHTDRDKFNLIDWLVKNNYEYYDYRPQGNLYIIDTVNMRTILRSLRSKGYYFTLSLSNSLLPDNKSAWILK